MRIDVNSITRKLEVDNRIPLHHYYRIADNLLRQASVYREERNAVDLHIILLRFSSLVSETVPLLRDYPAIHPKEKTRYKKSAGVRSSSPWRYRNDHSQIVSPNPVQLDKQFQKTLGEPAKFDTVAVKDASKGDASTAMESVLSLDDGMRSRPVEKSFPVLIDEVQEDPFKLVSIKQPSPPPVLARLQQGNSPIPPSQVAIRGLGLQNLSKILQIPTSIYMFL